MAIVVAVCDLLGAPRWIAIGLPVLICGVTVVTWIVRLARWAARRTAQG